MDHIQCDKKKQKSLYGQHALIAALYDAVLFKFTNDKTMLYRNVS
jgi:hypothetical protein